VGLLVLLALAQLAVHLNALGILRIPAWAGIALGLDVMLFVLCVMGGRVIPMFTNNGVPSAKAVRLDWLEKIALGVVLGLLVVDALHAPGIWIAPLATLAMAAHLARWCLWQPWKTWRAPLVWVLHVAYLWIPVHLLLRAMVALDWVSPSVAHHALTAGAIGGMVIGMMTRTSLGHTGRKLIAGSTEVSCYALITGAAVMRVFLPLLNPSWITVSVSVSSLLWSAGFALFAWRYWPILSRS